MGAPNPFQKLKHGVILCKKNFRTFVETFNFIVDFAQCLKGDGDGMGDGLIMVDRSIPNMPVIRSKIGYSSLISNLNGDGDKNVFPWTFECEEDEEGVRTGGWMDCMIQVGLEIYSGDYMNRMPLPNSRKITNCEQTDDGDYYVEVKPSSHTAQLKRMASAPSQSFATDTYYVYIGTVENGVQKYSVCCAPVIYTYL